MATDPDKSLVPHGRPGTALVRSRPPEPPPELPLGVGLFCAAPTILEAINLILLERGVPTLWVQPDGEIGPTDPLVGRVEYVPSPFVW